MINIRDKPIKEITLRRYEKPHSELDERALIRKFCLSVGLLNPGDKRDSIVDIIYVLIFAKEPLGVSEIKQKVEEIRQKYNLPINGLSESNIRRQLKRLKDLYLIERIGSAYAINENLRFVELFENHFKRYLIIPILERINDYCKAIDELKERKEN